MKIEKATGYKRKKYKCICSMLTACLLCTVGLFIISGCQHSVSARQEIEVVSRGGSVQLVEAPGTQIPEKAADYAYVLFAKATEASQAEENVLISPLSAFLALAMTSQGAQGDTAEAFQQCFQGLTPAEQRTLSAYLIHRLTTLKGDTELHIANSIWCDDEISVREDFISQVEQYFGADIIAEDLQGKYAVDKVNRWLGNQTEEKITNMIEDLPQDAVMLLVNTLYLNAKWQMPFPDGKSHMGPFTLQDGTTVEASYMRSDLLNYGYLQSDAGEGILLPYQDGHLAFLAFLPAKDYTCENVVQNLSASNIHQLLTQIKQPQALPLVVQMPKFEVSYGADLKNQLQQMGLSMAFDPALADLSGLGTAQGNLWIGQVMQRCVMRVGEEGTEAAAATVVEILNESAMIEPEFCLVDFNRPFVYMIMDTEMEIPLFAGVMRNPAEAVYQE